MILKKLVSTSLVALLFVAVPGCLERSTVVKVNRDGSGIVHIRNHDQEVNIVIGGKKAETEDKESKLPSMESLDRIAKEMGSGVRVKSIKPSKNRSGWKGYDLIFEFDDINQMVLTDSLANIGDKDSDDAENADGKKEPAEKEPLDREFRFTMKDGTLEIFSLAYDQPAKNATPADEPQDGAIDPFAQEPAGSSPTFSLQETAMTQLYAKLLSDVRIGVFVQVNGPIESTNALHRDESLITLVNVNVGKMLEDENAVSKLKSIEHLENDPDRRAKIQEMANETDGLDVDTQKKIVVKWGD